MYNPANNTAPLEALCESILEDGMQGETCQLAVEMSLAHGYIARSQLGDIDAVNAAQCRCLSEAFAALAAKYAN